MQKRKGISLIVLVITIIVMIVLAGAIILSLNNAGIIEKSNQAVSSTDEATVKELAQMAWAEAYASGVRKVDGENGLEAKVKESLRNNGLNVNDYGILVTTKGVEIVKGWIQDKTIIRRGDQELTIGQTVNYDDGVDTYSGGWKLLGADEDGNILVMSDTDVATEFSLYTEAVTLETAQSTWLSGGVNKLNDECAKYGNGTGAINARSITVEDVNKATGYNPSNVDGKGTIYQYGNTATYTYNGTTKPTYAGTNEVTADLTTDHTGGFYWYDGEGFHKVTADELKTEANKGKEIAKITSNYYYYAGISKLSAESDAYKMLFGTSDGYNRYWLASSYSYMYTRSVYFGVRVVFNGGVGLSRLWDSTGSTSTPARGVRAVVTLSSDIDMSELI